MEEGAGKGFRMILTIVIPLTIERFSFVVHEVTRSRDGSGSPRTGKPM